MSETIAVLVRPKLDGIRASSQIIGVCVDVCVKFGCRDDIDMPVQVREYVVVVVVVVVVIIVISLRQ